jgi:hypothetical protein
MLTEKDKDANSVLDKLRARYPAISLSSYDALNYYGSSDVASRMRSALRKAGLPE